MVVFVMLVSVGVEIGIGKERKRLASSVPVCEVPWRRMRVVLWVCGGRGMWMKGGGWFAAILFLG